MFQVKATVIGFLGNKDIYPCHMGHKVGDEVIFDGESYTGRLCPDVWPLIVPKVTALHQAGPRYVEWGSYYPFWYCSVSQEDPSCKKYDGLGYRNVLKTIVPPKYDMANLVPPNAFEWPPHPERNVATAVTVICPDTRTSMVVKMEAFDLAEKGFDTPYFRRQMVMLDRVSRKQGIAPDKILNEFSKDEVEKIYPPISQIMLGILLEELVLMGYAQIKESGVYVTGKGEAKIHAFKQGLTTEEREALNV